MVLPTTGSVWFAMLYFAAFLKPEQMYKRSTKISKMCNYKYGIHVKKQYSKSEMTQLSPLPFKASGIRLIKLLK
jgi:hypothetical protein